MILSAYSLNINIQFAIITIAYLREKENKMSEKQKKHEWAGVGPDGRNERGVVSNLVLDIHSANVAARPKMQSIMALDYQRTGQTRIANSPMTDAEIDEAVRGPIASW